jgi:hypothetical protein
MNALKVDELSPPPPPKDIHESLAAYLELLDLGDVFVRAGLRQRLGPGADIEAAYRAWNREQIERAANEKIRNLEARFRGEVADVR